MKKRPWMFCFLLSLLTHAALAVIVHLVGLDWMTERDSTPPALEVGIISERAVSAAAGGDNAAGADAAPAASGPKIRMTSAAALQDVQKAIAQSEQATHTIADASTTPAEAPAAAQTSTTVAAKAGVPSKGSSEAAGSMAGDAGEGQGRGTSPSGEGQGNGGASAGLGAGFSDNGDGSYTAEASSGISYTILRDAQAEYPEEARALGYSSVVTISARILVDTNGSIESVRILSDAPNLGFRQAAEEALWGMRFAPIIYQGYPIKMWFEKNIIFTP